MYITNAILECIYRLLSIVFILFPVFIFIFILRRPQFNVILCIFAPAIGRSSSRSHPAEENPIDVVARPGNNMFR